MANHTTAENIINLLNEALALDPKGFAEMILARHEINEDLANHPTIQASVLPLDQEEKYIRESGVKVTMVNAEPKYGLSAIGLLNGLLDGTQFVTAVIDAYTNEIKEFILLDGEPKE